jgi:GNAT superfamily N-acetyltransferase
MPGAGLVPDISAAGTLTGDDADRFRLIYEAGFPAAEREPAGELLAAIARGEHESVVARLDGAIAGFAVWRQLTAVPCAYLEYLVVDAGRRSTGIGGRVLKAVGQHFANARVRPESVVFEVEPPYAAYSDERAMRSRRIAFYERNGGRVLIHAPLYKAPRLDGVGILPFILMEVPFTAGSRPPSGDALRAIAKAILVEGYGLDPGSELVRSVVNDILE